MEESEGDSSMLVVPFAVLGYDDEELKDNGVMSSSRRLSSFDWWRWRTGRSGLHFYFNMKKKQHKINETEFLFSIIRKAWGYGPLLFKCKESV